MEPQLFSVVPDLVPQLKSTNNVTSVAVKHAEECPRGIVVKGQDVSVGVLHRDAPSLHTAGSNFDVRVLDRRGFLQQLTFL